jgi:hypothetical protein
MSEEWSFQPAIDRHSPQIRPAFATGGVFSRSPPPRRRRWSSTRRSPATRVALRSGVSALRQVHRPALRCCPAARDQRPGVRQRRPPDRSRPTVGFHRHTRPGRPIPRLHRRRTGIGVDGHDVGTLATDRRYRWTVYGPQVRRQRTLRRVEVVRLAVLPSGTPSALREGQCVAVGSLDALRQSTVVPPPRRDRHRHEPPVLS